MSIPPNPRASEAAVIPVLAERLDIAREVVETGAVRVRKHVHEVLVDVDEPVVHETVQVRRVPIGRVLTEPASVRHEGDVMVVPVVEERLVTRKELVLVEEIHLTRHRHAKPARAQVSLRRERVSVERFDPLTQQWLAEGES